MTTLSKRSPRGSVYLSGYTYAGRKEKIRINKSLRCNGQAHVIWFWIKEQKVKFPSGFLFICSSSLKLSDNPKLMVYYKFPNTEDFNEKLHSYKGRFIRVYHNRDKSMPHNYAEVLEDDFEGFIVHFGLGEILPSTQLDESPSSLWNGSLHGNRRKYEIIEPR